MNKFNNPRLTNTTVSGTGVKHPMRPHVILGDPENGFIRGDLLDANAVIKLIKNAAKAIGALEELEQSNWIDDDAKTEEPAEETVGVLGDGEIGFGDLADSRILIQGAGDDALIVLYIEGSSNYNMAIVDNRAFGMTVQSAFDAGYVVKGEATRDSGPAFSEVATKVINYATFKA